MVGRHGVHSKRRGGKHNVYYKRTILLPPIASCAKTGDMLGVDLRQGPQGEARGCYGFTRRISLCLHNYVASQRDYSDGCCFFNSGALGDKLEGDGFGDVMWFKK